MYLREVEDVGYLQPARSRVRAAIEDMQRALVSRRGSLKVAGLPATPWKGNKKKQLACEA